MKTSQKGIDFIKRHEALRLHAYKDAVGVWTIGYGHTSTAKQGMIITEAEAEKLLKQDLKTAEDEINKHLLPLKQHQFDSLTSFVFNIGVGAFRRSTLLKRLRVDVNHPDIVNQFNRWVYGGGKILKGLVKRRREEANLYITGDYGR
jgi:lysozyme